MPLQAAMVAQAAQAGLVGLQAQEQAVTAERAGRQELPVQLHPEDLSDGIRLPVSFKIIAIVL
jgi:hypothetical protein